MDDSWNEDEKLAALLDGRLDARMREAMLSRLMEDDEAYEMFTSLSAILRQAEAEDVRADAAAPSLNPRGRPRRGEARWGEVQRRWLALAATLAGVALAPGWTLGVRASLAGDPEHLAARLAHASDGLPAGWTEPPAWSSSR